MGDQEKTAEIERLLTDMCATIPDGVRPMAILSAFLMGMNELAESCVKHAPMFYRKQVAKSLRQCADHFEVGKTPDYTHEVKGPNRGKACSSICRIASKRPWRFK